MERMLTEFKRHCLPPQSIRDMMEGTGKSEYEDERILSDKLHDLYICTASLRKSGESICSI
ncbi:hypothetical protein PO124_10490 [Bacillus licheniformis]|nr:hypothetical protein [Bacillus licheniformis]